MEARKRCRCAMLGIGPTRGLSLLTRATCMLGALCWQCCGAGAACCADE